jgi:hypothetical protein
MPKERQEEKPKRYSTSSICDDYAYVDRKGRWILDPDLKAQEAIDVVWWLKKHQSNIEINYHPVCGWQVDCFENRTAYEGATIIEAVKAAMEDLP